MSKSAGNANAQSKKEAKKKQEQMLKDKAVIDKAISEGPAKSTTAGALQEGGVEGLQFQAVRISNKHPELDAIDKTTREAQAEIDALKKFMEELGNTQGAAGQSGDVDMEPVAVPEQTQQVQVKPEQATQHM